MNDFAKIGYYDLKLEQRSGRLPKAVGFAAETARLTRVLTRSLQHNAIVSAPSGCGKTALVLRWSELAATQPVFANKKIVLLNSATLQKVGQLPQSSLPSYQDAFSSLTNSVLIIDSFGEMIYQNPQGLQNWNTLLKPLFFREDISVVLTMQPEELLWLSENKSHFLSHFETVKLEPAEDAVQLEILQLALERSGVNAYDGVAELILRLCRRFPILGQLPKSALRLLDEATADVKISGADVKLTKAAVEKIVAEKTGVPLSQLSQDERQLLKTLPQTLNSKIVGQQQALGKIISVIQRAKLGLRNQNRPLASFLVLGPSGVGKTETAKILAETLYGSGYGSGKHFLRVDMSEFGQEHSSARLLGSPAGYVGFEAGGQLTNHFQNQPYSLLLLDEIEKAHSKIFDIFLQVLDDGRITSARGETVDLSQSVIMATSNMAVPEILDGFKTGQDVYGEQFLKSVIVPSLLKHLRMEFLNRFDAILIYKPLSAEDLTDIALLEIAKIEHRMQQHNIRFSVSRETLAEKLKGLADPRFGARPVKRFVEETCENLITQKLLQETT